MYKEYAKMATEEAPGAKAQKTDGDEAVPMETRGSSSSSSGMKRANDVPLKELEASIGQVMVEMDLREAEDVYIKQVTETDGVRVAWDDVNNVELLIELVDEARQEETKYLNERTWRIAKKTECWEKTGKAPVSVKWVDTDKSHGQKKILVRSRLVARDFKTKGERDRQDLFCATPPLELMRFLVSRAATVGPRNVKKKMLFIDVRKAHWIPKCEEDVYVDLPKEAKCGDDECGKLKYWLYGVGEQGKPGKTTTRRSSRRRALRNRGRVRWHLPSTARAVVGCARRRLHLQWMGRGLDVDRGPDESQL